MAEKVKIVIEADAKRATDAVKKVNKELKNQEKSVKKLTAGFKVFGAVVGTAVVAGFTKATKSAIDFEETLSKFNTVFKDVQKEATKTRENLAKNFGLSSQAATKLLGDTGDLLSGFGFTGKAALDLSKNVNELAVDLASFTNAQGGAEATSAALTKSLLGERESLKTYGIAILEADVKQRLFEKGQQNLTGTALRQAKATATLELAMEQSKNAIGDFARTSDSTANIIRRIRAQFADAATELGAAFIPALRTVGRLLLNLGKSKAEIIVSDYQAAVKAAAEAQMNYNSVVEEFGKQPDQAALANLKLLKANNDLNKTRREAEAAQKKIIKNSGAEIAENEKVIKTLKTKKKTLSDSVKTEELAATIAQNRLKRFKEENLITEETTEAALKYAGTLDEYTALTEAANKAQSDYDNTLTELTNATYLLTEAEEDTAEVKAHLKLLNTALAKGDKERIAALLAEWKARKNLNAETEEGAKASKAQGEAFSDFTSILESEGARRVAGVKAQEDELLEIYKGNETKREEIVKASARKIRMINAETAKGVADTVSQTTQDIAGIVQSLFDIQIQALSNELSEFKAAQEEKSRILDEELQRELERQGVADDTAAERAEKNLASLQEQLAAETDEKKRAILEEEIAEEQKALKKAKIEEDFQNRKKQLATETAAKEKELERKIAEEKRKAFIADKIAKIAQIAMSTAAGIMNIWATTPNPIAAGVLTGIVGTLGTVQAGIVAAQPVPAFATGGSMMTDGPQMFLAGDNPGGRERIDVTPLDNSTINNNQNTTNAGTYNIQVMANDPIQFANELQRVYGVDVFTGANV